MEKTNSNERFRGKDANIDGNKRLRFQKENGKTQLIPIYKNKSVDHGNSPAKWLGFITPDGQTRYIPVFDTWHGNSGSKGEPGPMTTSIGQVCNLCFSNCNKNYVNCQKCVSGCNDCDTCQKCNDCQGCQSCTEGHSSHSGTLNSGCGNTQTVETCGNCYTNTQCSSCFSPGISENRPDDPKPSGSGCGSTLTLVPCNCQSGQSCCDSSSKTYHDGCGNCYVCVTCDGSYTYISYNPGYKEDSAPCCHGSCFECQSCDKCQGCYNCNSCDSSCNSSICNGCQTCNNPCTGCNSCQTCVSCQSCNSLCHEENTGYCGPSYDPK